MKKKEVKFREREREKTPQQNHFGLVVLFLKKKTETLREKYILIYLI